jgi:hypothetical protein
MIASQDSSPVNSAPAMAALPKQAPMDLLRATEWTMHYKFGPTPHVTKNFKLDGTLREAIARSQEHCRIMGYRLIQVNALFSDLTLEESGRIPMAAAGFGKAEAHI